MSTEITLSSASRDASIRAILDQLDGGSLSIYAGLRPLTPDTPAEGSALLAVMAWGDPAFDDLEEGAAEATEIAPVYAVKTGQPIWYRASGADGEPVFDGWADERGLNLPSEIVRQALVVISRFTYDGTESG